MVHVSELEQAVVEEINLARTRPRDYAGCVHTVLRGQVHSGAEELFNVLRVRSPVSNVKISKGLSMAARKRAEAVACGMQSYEPGLDLSKRVGNHGTVDDPTSLKEVVWVGRYGEDVRRAVLAMLADESNPTRSRRTSLLSATAGVSGVACSGNVICLIFCKSFYEGVPSNATPVYGRSFAGKLEEPTRQEPLPVRQVMTPMHTTAWRKDAQYSGGAGTPRLHEYEDIRKIINTMPVPRRRDEDTTAQRSHAAQAGTTAAHTTSNNIGPNNVVPSNLPRNIPPPARPAYDAPRPAYDSPAPRAEHVVSPRPREETTRKESGYSGIIVGLEGLKTTLSTETGESNYVGFNTSLRDRISKWLTTVHHPTIVQ